MPGDSKALRICETAGLGSLVHETRHHRHRNGHTHPSAVSDWKRCRVPSTIIPAKTLNQMLFSQKCIIRFKGRDSVAQTLSSRFDFKLK
jgi:hypothetical protein